MFSFAKQVKKELCNLGEKQKNCCGYSMLYGLLFCSDIIDGYASLKILNNNVGEKFVALCKQHSVKSTLDYKYSKNRIEISSEFIRCNSIQDLKTNVFKCGRCKESFLRGVFLAVGTVNDPEKSYRLDLVFNDEKKASEIRAFLLDIGIESLFSKRKGKSVLYFRRSEAIEDFFANIGATSLAFDIMNSKINKELINNANRVTNCDAANINKALRASDKYNTAINYLFDTQEVNLLPPHLREMAEKRILHKELSFTELGKQFSPPISKSGVHHRLDKILEFYCELINNKK